MTRGELAVIREWTAVLETHLTNHVRVLRHLSDYPQVVAMTTGNTRWAARRLRDACALALITATVHRGDREEVTINETTEVESDA